MVSNPSWEASSSSCNRQTLHISSNPKVQHVYNSLPHVAVMSHISPINFLYPVSWRSVVMLFTLLNQGVPNCLSVRVSETKAMHNSFPQSMLHTAPISSVSVLKQYLMTNRDFESSHNMIFIPVLPFILGPDIILSTPISKNPSLCSSLLVRDQVSHP